MSVLCVPGQSFGAGDCPWKDRNPPAFPTLRSLRSLTSLSSPSATAHELTERPSSPLLWAGLLTRPPPHLSVVGGSPDPPTARPLRCGRVSWPAHVCSVAVSTVKKKARTNCVRRDQGSNLSPRLPPSTMGLCPNADSAPKPSQSSPRLGERSALCLRPLRPAPGQSHGVDVSVAWGRCIAKCQILSP